MFIGSTVGRGDSRGWCFLLKFQLILNSFKKIKKNPSYHNEEYFSGFNQR